MPKITLAKAARYPFDSRVIHPSGTVLEVSEADMESFRSRGLVAKATQASEPASEIKVERTLEPQESKAPSSTSRYPELPKKSAPVAEWKEYARLNEIKLTGLTKRNEIIGHITKIIDNQ